MRLGLRLAAIVAGLLFCVPLHYLWKLFRARSIWPQIFLGYAGACCGVRARRNLARLIAEEEAGTRIAAE